MKRKKKTFALLNSFLSRLCVIAICAGVAVADAQLPLVEDQAEQLDETMDLYNEGEEQMGPRLVGVETISLSGEPDDLWQTPLDDEPNQQFETDDNYDPKGMTSSLQSLFDRRLDGHGRSLLHTGDVGSLFSRYCFKRTCGNCATNNGNSNVWPYANCGGGQRYNSYCGGATCVADAAPRCYECNGGGGGNTNGGNLNPDNLRCQNGNGGGGCNNNPGGGSNCGVCVKYVCYSCTIATYNWGYQENDKACPVESSPGCSTILGPTGNTDCLNKLTSIGWSPNIIQTHNEYDTVPIVVGGWPYYLENTNYKCHTVCQFTNTGAKNLANGGFNQYLTLDQLSGEFTYYLRRPFRLQNIRFSCDNGFDKLHFVWDLWVKCHDTSTVITMNTAPVFVQHQIWVINGAQPFHYFPRFSSLESNCPIDFKRTTADTDATALTNGLVDHASGGNIINHSSNQFKVYVQNAYRENTRYYEYYVKVTARGGAQYWTPLMTLNVTCGPASTDITEGTYERNQVYEVGSDHGFVFEEFRSRLADCPIEGYRIVQTGGTYPRPKHPDFPAAESVWNTAQDQQSDIDDLMTGRVQDTTIKTTYSFRIETWAKGGQTFSTNIKTLTFRCMEKHSTMEPFDYNSQVFVNKPSNTPLRWDFSPFTSTHWLCPINRYYLDRVSTRTNNAYNPPAQVNFEPSCVTALGVVCRTVDLDVSALGTYDFWVVARAEATPADGVRSWHKVTVTVGCGGEQLAVSPTSATRLYARDTSAPITPYTENFWRPYFTNDNSAFCPTEAYELWADEACTVAFVPAVDSNVTLNSAGPPAATAVGASVSLLSGAPIWQKKFWIRGRSSGGQTALFAFTYSICGFETMEATTAAQQDHWYYAEAPDRNQGLEWEYLDAFFKFEHGPMSDPWCYDQQLAFFLDEDCLIPWVNPSPPRVDLDWNYTAGTQRVHVWTPNPFPETILYMKRETRGGQRALVSFAFEVCGLETASLVPEAAPLEKHLRQFERAGAWPDTVLISYLEYRSNFTSTSRQCPPRRFGLYYQDESGAYVPWTETLVTLDPVSLEIHIKTHVPYAQQLFIAPEGHANMVYLPLNVSVTRRTWGSGLDYINQPPHLALGIENLWENATVENWTSTYSIPLSEFRDDLNEWQSLELSAPGLGTLIYTNETGVTNRTSLGQVLGYDSSANAITFNFDGFDHILDNLGLHTIKVKLADARGLWSTYYPNATFVSPGHPPGQYATRAYGISLTAWIESIDRYGLCRIRFVKPMWTEGTPLSSINSTTLDVYVAPADDRYEDNPNFDLTKFNLTWKALEFQGDTMLLELIFPHHPWISTELNNPDDLVIVVRNTAENLAADVPRANEIFTTWHTETHEEAKARREGRGRPRRLRATVNEGDATGQHFLPGVHLRTDLHEYFVERNATMRHPIPRQYQGGWSLKVLKTYTDSKAELLKVTIVVSFLGKVLSIGNSFHLLAAMVCSLQLAVHLPIMQYVFPTNVMVHLHGMIPIAMLDVLENLEFYQDIFKSRAAGEETYDLREQVKDLHYDQHNPWLNMGTISLALWAWVIRVVLLYLFIWPFVHYAKLKHAHKAVAGNQRYEGGRTAIPDAYRATNAVAKSSTDAINPDGIRGVRSGKGGAWDRLKESGWIGGYQEPPQPEFGKPGGATFANPVGAAAASKPRGFTFAFGWKLKHTRPRRFSAKKTCLQAQADRFHSWRRSLFWGEFFFIFLLGHLECLLCATLWWDVPNASFENTGWLGTTSVVLLAITCVAMPAALIYILTRDVRRYRLRHFAIRWGALYSAVRTRNKPQMFYYFLFVMRRINYVLIVYLWMMPHPIYQLLSLELTNLGMLIYFAAFFPRASWQLNFLEACNEVQVTLCTWHLMVFSPWVPDYDTQYFMGWVFIILLSAITLINMVFIFLAIAREIRLLIIKYWQYLMLLLHAYCYKEPVVIPPPPPPPPPVIPPKPRIASYQPQMLALVGGRVTKMVDAEGKDVKRVLATDVKVAENLNDDGTLEVEVEEDQNGDRWKHQAGPAEVKGYGNESKAGEARPDWVDIPGFVSRMGDVDKASGEHRGQVATPQLPKDYPKEYRQINPAPVLGWAERAAKNAAKNKAGGQSTPPIYMEDQATGGPQRSQQPLYQQQLQQTQEQQSMTPQQQQHQAQVVPRQEGASRGGAQPQVLPPAHAGGLAKPRAGPAPAKKAKGNKRRGVAGLLSKILESSDESGSDGGRKSKREVPVKASPGLLWQHNDVAATPEQATANASRASASSEALAPAWNSSSKGAPRAAPFQAEDTLAPGEDDALERARKAWQAASKKPKAAASQDFPANPLAALVGNRGKGDRKTRLEELFDGPQPSNTNSTADPRGTANKQGTTPNQLEWTNVKHDDWSAASHQQQYDAAAQATKLWGRDAKAGAPAGGRMPRAAQPSSGGGASQFGWPDRGPASQGHSGAANGPPAHGQPPGYENPFKDARHDAEVPPKYRNGVGGAFGGAAEGQRNQKR